MDLSAGVGVPEMTALDAAQQTVAGIVYLAIAAAALGYAPRDPRTQVFFTFSVANAVAFAVPVYAWFTGVTNPLEMNRTFQAISFSALCLGGLLLFHFSQIFPRRRPWITRSGVQMPAAYILTPAIVMSLAYFWPSDQVIGLGFVIALLVFGFPLIVVMGLVLPVGAILSLVRSYREAAVGTGVARARPVIGAILLSQVAGGVLGVVFLPVLTVIAPGSYALKFFGFTMWALTLLTPLAFAAGVWKHRLLEVDPVTQR